jgi:hypothetical protein
VAQTVVEGSFRYRDDPESSGTLLYARLGVTPNHPWDVRAYLRANANFPNASTLAQLYDGAEFEAYRAMGERTGEDVVTAAAPAGAGSQDGTPDTRRPDGAPLTPVPSGPDGGPLAPLAVSVRPANGGSSRSVFKVRRRA